MAKRVAEKTPVAYFAEKPGDGWSGDASMWSGAGYYTLENVEDNNHTRANLGEKVNWVKTNPDAVNDDGVVQIDHENNEGYFVHAESGKQGGE